MEKNTLTRLKIELESFKALVIANLIGAALTLAFSIAFGVTKIIPFISGGPLTPDQIPYLIVIISGFVVAITWITNSAELMGEQDDITKDFDELIDDYESIMNVADRLEAQNDEAIIGLIVRSLAFYRENSGKIAKLKWGGRLTGTFLIVSGLPQLWAFITGTYPYQGWLILAQAFALICSLGIGAAAWYAPVIIKRFTETWDARLGMVDDANAKLDRILEGDE